MPNCPRCRCMRRPRRGVERHAGTARWVAVAGGPHHFMPPGHRRRGRRSKLRDQAGGHPRHPSFLWAEPASSAPSPMSCRITLRAGTFPARRPVRPAPHGRHRTAHRNLSAIVWTERTPTAERRCAWTTPPHARAGPRMGTHLAPSGCLAGAGAIRSQRCGGALTPIRRLAIGRECPRMASIPLRAGASISASATIGPGRTGHRGRT